MVVAAKGMKLFAIFIILDLGWLYHDLFLYLQYYVAKAIANKALNKIKFDNSGFNRIKVVDNFRNTRWVFAAIFDFSIYRSLHASAGIDYSFREQFIETAASE